MKAREGAIGYENVKAILQSSRQLIKQEPGPIKSALASQVFQSMLTELMLCDGTCMHYQSTTSSVNE